MVFFSTSVSAAPRPVTLKSADGWTLSALYQPASKNKPVVVFVHGVGAGKGEWTDFAAELAALGYGTLALDLRGHGESLAGPHGRRNYESFSAQDFASAAADLDAALAFLKNKKVPAKRIGLIGGSLGANFSARADGAAWAVLLSLGQDYMGVTLPQNWGTRKVLAAAAPEDVYSFRSCLAAAQQPNGPVFFQGKKGHGAQLLGDPDFKKKLVQWIQSRR